MGFDAVWVQLDGFPVSGQLDSRCTLCFEDISDLQTAGARSKGLEGGAGARRAEEELLQGSRSPDAPHGQISVGQANALLDDFGNSYTSLLFGPARLSEPDISAGDQPRMLQNVPTFVDSGMTITLWYRHVECAPGDSCGVFLLWADGQGGAGAPAGCERRGIWSLWLETDGIWFDNVKGSPKYQYPLNFMPPRSKWTGSQVWRHIAFKLDESKNAALLYMDGRLAVSVPWGSDVVRADCPLRSVALGHSTPGWTYGAEVSRSRDIVTFSQVCTRSRYVLCCHCRLV